MDNIIEKIHQCFNQIPRKDNRAHIGPLEFVTFLVLCFSRDGNAKSLAGLRRGLIAETGKKIARSTFWKRLATRRLQTQVQQLIGQLIVSTTKKLSIFSTILSLLGVSGIYLLDSSSSTLPQDASDSFPAPRNNVVPASIKWHCLWDLLGGGLRWFELSPATEHDRKHVPPMGLLNQALIIMDLGYFDFTLLNEIALAGGYFLCRLKSNTHVEILKIIEGLPERFEGKILSKSKLPKGRKIIEVVGSFGSQGKPKMVERVIGFWNPIEKTYHWYVTNLEVKPELIYPLYRLRWQIELVFKAAKSSLRLADFSSANTNIILNIHLATIAASLLGTSICQAMIIKMEDEKVFAVSVQRTYKVVIHLAISLNQLIVQYDECSKRAFKKKTKLLMEELWDPNLKNRENALTTDMRVAFESS